MNNERSLFTENLKLVNAIETADNEAEKKCKIFSCKWISL